MKRSKIIFLVLAAIFFLIMIWVSYDISSRTTFPGSKPQLRERLKGADDKASDTPEKVETDSSSNR